MSLENNDDECVAHEENIIFLSDEREVRSDVIASQDLEHLYSNAKGVQRL